MFGGQIVKTKEHGDLFKAELVRALLNTKPGTIGKPIDPTKPAKGQTRRVVKASNSRVNGEPSNRYDWTRFDFSRATVDPLAHPVLKVPYLDENNNERIHTVTPKWIEGDGMWVKETFIQAHAVGGYAEGVDPETDPHGPTIDIIYRADDGANERTAGPWTSSIFMPRKLSRISMEIVDIWPERIQDITNNDAWAEGMIGELKPVHQHVEMVDYIGPFRKIWDSINGKDYPLENNDWVWVREFRMVSL